MLLVNITVAQGILESPEDKGHSQKILAYKDPFLSSIRASKTLSWGVSHSVNATAIACLGCPGGSNRVIWGSQQIQATQCFGVYWDFNWASSHLKKGDRRPTCFILT